MNWIDIFIAIPLAYAMWKGFKKGFVLEIFSLLALLVGIYVGIHFSTWVSKAIAGSFNMNPVYLPIVAFIITFGGVALLIYMTGKSIERTLKTSKLSTLNQVAGSGLGAIKASIIEGLAVSTTTGGSGFTSGTSIFTGVECAETTV